MLPVYGGERSKIFVVGIKSKKLAKVKSTSFNKMFVVFFILFSLVRQVYFSYSIHIYLFFAAFFGFVRTVTFYSYAVCHACIADLTNKVDFICTVFLLQVLSSIIIKLVIVIFSILY